MGAPSRAAQSHSQSSASVCHIRRLPRPLKSVHTSKTITSKHIWAKRKKKFFEMAEISTVATTAQLVGYSIQAVIIFRKARPWRTFQYRHAVGLPRRGRQCKNSSQVISASLQIMGKREILKISLKVHEAAYRFRRMIL